MTPTPTTTATPTYTMTPTATPIVTETPTPTYTPAVEPPSAITLIRFVAHVQVEGIALRWETGTEFATLGFRLWRSTDGERQHSVQIGDIFGHKGTPTSGAIYGHVDATVTPGVHYTYWLEEVRRDATTEELASISVFVANSIYLPLIAG